MLEASPNVTLHAAPHVALHAAPCAIAIHTRHASGRPGPLACTHSGHAPYLHAAQAGVECGAGHAAAWLPQHRGQRAVLLCGQRQRAVLRSAGRRRGYIHNCLRSDGVARTSSIAGALLPGCGQGLQGEWWGPMLLQAQASIPRQCAGDESSSPRLVRVPSLLCQSRLPCVAPSESRTPSRPPIHASDASADDDAANRAPAG